ncbi:MAG: sulfite exporter TauE/SafE family protein [Oscillospiraceae bacterium]|nr:sulfite exporter TauE/SafE family protein [Oscillospiraceae bacterium]
MDVTALQFIIICPLIFLAGFVDAVAGGGGLISLPAYMIAGLPVHMAIGTNKLSSGMETALATWRFARNGYIVWKQAALCVICALLGSSAGAHLALLLSDEYFKIIMLIILPLTAFYVLRCHSLDLQNVPYSEKKTTILSMIVATVIGVYDGFYGPGTGTFLLLLLTAIAHMLLQSANGVAKVINLTTNLTALAVYLLNGKVILILGLTAGYFSVAGNYVGTWFFTRWGAKSVKPLMLVVLVIFFIKICSDLIA